MMLQAVLQNPKFDTFFQVLFKKSFSLEYLTILSQASKQRQEVMLIRVSLSLCKNIINFGSNFLKQEQYSNSSSNVIEPFPKETSTCKNELLPKYIFEFLSLSSHTSPSQQQSRLRACYRFRLCYFIKYILQNCQNPSLEAIQGCSTEQLF